MRWTACFDSLRAWRRSGAWPSCAPSRRCPSSRLATAGHDRRQADPGSDRDRRLAPSHGMLVLGERDVI